MIALTTTFAPLGAEFGVAYTKRTFSFGATLSTQVLAPVDVYAAIVTRPKPLVSTTPFLTVATFVFEEYQLTPAVDDLRSIDFPLGMLDTLLSEILTDVPDFTTTVHVALLPPVDAVIYAVPGDFAVTTPLASTVAIEVLELDQVTGVEAVAWIAS